MSDRMAVLERIADTAHKLEDFLGRNAGDNADWPVRLKADDEAIADEFSDLLETLRLNLLPYRDELSRPRR